MPELPDIVTYIEALRPRILGETIQRVRIASPFLVRTVEPPISAIDGCTADDVFRIGKRIVVRMSNPAANAGNIFLVFHLMIAGRFRWGKPGAKPPGKIGLAAFEFPSGTLLMTEASHKRRASLHVVGREAELARHDPGGIEILDDFAWKGRIADQGGSTDGGDRHDGKRVGFPTPRAATDATEGEFASALTREVHTLKRALTDPRLFSGIGNAYSDEILHAARLSPIALTSRLSADEIGRLHAAARETLKTWIARLREEFDGRFPGPGEITAFRPGFAVHGRFGQPCPNCGTAVQRIRYSENETNYCPRCQTEGRILADRSLSRLLKDDWPRSIDELE